MKIVAGLVFRIPFISPCARLDGLSSILTWGSVRIDLICRVAANQSAGTLSSYDKDALITLPAAGVAAAAFFNL